MQIEARAQAVIPLYHPGRPEPVPVFPSAQLI